MLGLPELSARNGDKTILAGAFRVLNRIFV